MMWSRCDYLCQFRCGTFPSALRYSQMKNQLTLATGTKPSSCNAEVLVLTMENLVLDGVNRHYDTIKMTLRSDIDPLRIASHCKTRCTR